MQPRFHILLLFLPLALSCGRDAVRVSPSLARSLEELDGDHIGIRNVRERLKKMCGGTLTIDSRIGEGTTAVIRIPAAG